MLTKKHLDNGKILIFSNLGLKYCKLVNMEIKKLLKENNLSAMSIEEQNLEKTTISLIMRSDIDILVLTNSNADKELIKIYELGIKIIIINPHKEVANLLIKNNLINSIEYISIVKRKLEDF